MRLRTIASTRALFFAAQILRDTLKRLCLKYHLGALKSPPAPYLGLPGPSGRRSAAGAQGAKYRFLAAPRAGRLLPLYYRTEAMRIATESSFKMLLRAAPIFSLSQFHSTGIY